MSEDGRDAGALSRANQQQARSKRLERLHSNGDTSVVGVTVHKVCCVCGAVLNHKPRFRDGQGRYWCPTCNEADHERVRPVPCADCGIEMPRLEMKQVNDLLLCPVCVEKFMTDSRAVAEMRVRALSHGAKGPEKSAPVWPVVLVAAMLILVIALLIYQLSR